MVFLEGNVHAPVPACEKTHEAIGGSSYVAYHIGLISSLCIGEGTPKCGESQGVGSSPPSHTSRHDRSDLVAATLLSSLYNQNTRCV